MMLTDRFTAAVDYARVLHGSQVRKGSGVPYLAHLMSVAALVLEDGGDEDEAIAGLLHDAVEDQGGQATLAEIRRRFGERVAAIVLGCSDTDTVPKPPWRARKERYLAHLASASPSVLRVSLADKLHNARSLLTDLRALGDALWDRFQGGKAGTLWHYRALTEAYRAHGMTGRVDELDQVVGELERLAAR